MLWVELIFRQGPREWTPGRLLALIFLTALTAITAVVFSKQVAAGTSDFYVP